MPYNRSKIGEFGGVTPDVLTRNSFKIFDSSETEIIAIDFEKLGINTLHSKDRTLITEVQYADVRSIAGEIAPGLEIAHSYTPRPALEPVEMIGIGDNATVSRMYFKNRYASVVMPGETGIDSTEFITSSGSLMPVLPDEVSVDISAESISNLSAVLRIPIIPQLGFMVMAPIGNNDGSFIIGKNVTTLHFGVSSLGVMAGESNGIKIKENAFQEAPDKITQGDCISTVREMITGSNNTSRIALPSSLLTFKASDPYVCATTDSNAIDEYFKQGGIACRLTNDVVENFTYSVGMCLRRINTIKVSGMIDSFIAGAVVGKLIYRLTSLAPGAQNSYERRNLYDTSETYTPVSGKEYFVAVPDRVELSDLPTGVSLSVSMEEVLLAFDSEAAIEAKSIVRKKLATIEKESVYAYFLRGTPSMPHLHDNMDLPQPKGGLVDFPITSYAPEILRCVIGIELEDGRMLIPEDVDSALILPTGEPISQTLVCNKVVKRDGTNDDVSYTLDLAMGTKKVSVSLTRSTAKAVSPIAYGNPRIKDIDIIKMVVLDDTPPLPTSNVSCVERDESMHWDSAEGGWRVYGGACLYDYCSADDHTDSVNNKQTLKMLNVGSIPPTRRKHDVSVFFGNLDAVSDKIEAVIPVAYGSPVPVFTHKTAMQAHCERKGIASEYYATTIFPILFPQIVALKTDVLTRISFALFSYNKNPSSTIDGYSGNYSEDPNWGFLVGKLSDSRYGIDELPLSWDWVYRTGQKRLGFSLANLKRNGSSLVTGRYDVTLPWCNVASLTVSESFEVNGTLYTGSVLLVSPPALLENGAPETVTFTNDAVGTEFTGKNHVYSPLTIEAQNREFLATDEMLYEPSLLYPLTSTKDRYVQSYPAAVNGYLCISQFVFARMNDVTHIYLFTEKDIGLLASVHGQVAEYPIMSMAGLLFASVEPDKVVVYVYQNNSILPIKNVKAKNARACLVTDKQVGTVLYVLSGDNQLSVYLIDGPIITMNKSIPFTGSFSLSQYGAETEVMVTAANGKYLNLTSLDEVTEYHLKSSEFHFPLIEGYKPVLSGLKLVFDHVPNSTYDLRVWVNETCIFSKSNIPCDVESIQRFNTELPVGSASYEINNCTGILRNVFWLVYPLPLLTETIEKYAPSLNPPVLELEEKEESVEVTIRHTNGNPIIDIAYDEDFENCVEGYRGRIPKAGIPLPGFEATTTLTVPVTASGQTLYARAACIMDTQSSEYTLESLTLAPVSLSTPRLSHVVSSNQKAVIAIRGSEGEEYEDYVDGFEVELYKPGSANPRTIFAPMTQVTIPKHYVKAGSVAVKARACLNQFKSEYSNTIVIDFENLDVSSIYGISAVADETTATINWRAGGLYETFNLDLRDSNGMGRMITGIDELIANVTDLEPDTDYFVSIQAKYKNRLGDWSKVYRFRTTPRVTPVLTSFPMGGSAVMFECTSFKNALSYEFIIIETDERYKTDAPAFMFVPASPGSYSCIAELNMSDGSIKSSNTLQVQITGDMEPIEIDETNTTLDIIAEHTKEFKAGINIAWIIPDQYNRSGAQLLHYGIDIGYHDSDDYDLESDIIVGVRASSYYYEAHLQDRPEYFTVSVTAVYADGVNDTVSHRLYFT